MTIYNTEKIGIEAARMIITDLLKVNSMMSLLSRNIISKLTLVIDEITKVEVDNDIVTIYCKIDGNVAVVSISDEIKIKIKGE